MLIRSTFGLISRGSHGTRGAFAAAEEGLVPVLVLALAGLDTGLWLLGTSLGARFAESLVLAP